MPGQKYTFGTVKAAQARGDFQVLADRGRRALRVHLGKDVDAGLAKLAEAGAGSARARVEARSLRSITHRELHFEIYRVKVCHPEEPRHDATGTLNKEEANASGNGRAGQDGRQHGAPPDAGRTRSRSHRPERRQACNMAKEGAVASSSLEDFVGKLGKQRIAWLMVPAGEATEKTVQTFAKKMQSGDVIIDGGNSYFKDDIRRARELRDKGIHYVDVGTSGGVWGLDRGYCMMIGGPDDVVKQLDPIFKTLAPGRGNISRTPGREKLGGTAEDGYIHCGPPAPDTSSRWCTTASSTDSCRPMPKASISSTTPTAKSFPKNNVSISTFPTSPRSGGAAAWSASWLLDLTAIALAENPTLSEYTGFVQDSGEGRWTIQAAIDEAVPADVLSAAFIPASVRGRNTLLRRKCSPPCASNSADTSNRMRQKKRIGASQKI